MSYKLRFHESALAEWRRLDNSIREPFKKKLAERLENPHVPAAALSGMRNCYKIKLRGVGYRLIYRVDEEVFFLTIMAVGRRERQQVYGTARHRLLSSTKQV